MIARRRHPNRPSSDALLGIGGASGYVARGLPNGCGVTNTPSAYSIALQSDGKVVVGGKAVSSNGSADDMFAMRFLHQMDGSGNIVDSNFNSGNEDEVYFGCGTHAAAYAALPHLRIQGPLGRLILVKPRIPFLLVGCGMMARKSRLRELRIHKNAIRYIRN
jgi:hypothetical protein